MKKTKMAKGKVFLLCLGIAVLGALGCAGYRLIAGAMIDESNSVHIRAKEIEDSTLIIGSHLIYLGSMNDSIYETAQQSAEQSGQYSRYYKSELSDGVWYDITDASTLADITSEGVPVEDSVIEALNMTHHTKPDGITYDLVTGNPVCIYNISSPYNLEGLEELNPLKLQYDNLAALEEPSDTDLRNMQLIRDFYEKERTTEFTETCDRQILMLQVYYEVLMRDGEDSIRCDMVQKVMKRIDAARRVAVLEMLQDDELEQLVRSVTRNKQYDPEEAEESGGEAGKDGGSEAGTDGGNPDEGGTGAGSGTSGTESGSGSSEGGEGDGEDEENEEEEEDNKKIEGFFVDNNLLTGISEALSNVEESYSTYLGECLEEGTTVLSAAEYRAATRLSEFAEARNYVNCDEQVTWLLYLENINGGQIGDAAGELMYLEEILLPRADTAYRETLSAGVGAEYQALPSTAAGATKKSALRRQKNDTEAVRTELQFLLQAAMERMDPEAAIALVKERITDSENFRSGIKNDAYAEFATASLESYITWLGEQLEKLLKQQGGGEMDGLQEKKRALQEERLEALDQNDLAGAKRLEAEIEAVDRSIGDLEEALNRVLQSDTATPAEKAAAAAGLGSGTASAAIQEMCSGILENLRNGTLDGVEEAIEAIGGMADINPDATLAALKDIYKELSNQKLLEEAGGSGGTGGSSGGSGSGGTGGSGSTGGTGGTGGSGGSGDTSGTGGSGGSGGSGDTSGTGGTGGSGDTSGTGGSGGSGDTSGTGGSGGSGGTSGTGGSDGTGGSSGTGTEGTGGSGTGGSGGSGDTSGSGGSDGTGGSDSGSALDALLEKVEAVTAEQMNRFTKSLSESDLARLMDLQLGGDGTESSLAALLSRLTDSELAGALAGLGMFAEETGSKTAGDLLAAHAAAAYGKGNPCFYPKYVQEPGEEYVALDALAKVVRYRYIFHDSQKYVILQQGANYYGFTAFRTEVERPGEKEGEELSRQAGFLSTVYIEEDYTRTTFGVECYYFQNSDYAVLLDKESNETALAIFGYLMEAAGGE